MPTAKPTTAGPKPTFQRVEDKFYWQSDAGEFVIPLRFKTGFYRRLVTVEDPIQQLAMVLTEVEVPDALTALDDLDIMDSAKIAQAYFEAFAELGASLGE